MAENVPDDTSDLLWFSGEPLYREIEPEEAKERGGLRRTLVIEGDNGKYYHTDTEGYSLDATEIVHINGYEDGDNSSPMTLLVLKVRIHSTERNFSFLSVTTRLSFEGGKPSESSGDAEPSLVAFAPFSSTVTWSVSSEEQSRITNAGIEVGVNYGANVKVNGGGQWSVSKTKQYFARGNCTPMVSTIDDDRENGCKWYLEANPSQLDDVSPEFRVAILIKRKKKDEPFTATFKLRPEGGVFSGMQQGLRRVLGIDPRRTKKQFDGKSKIRTTPDGLDLLRKCNIDQNHLGKLITGESLTGLAYVWGLDPLSSPGATANRTSTAPAQGVGSNAALAATTGAAKP